MEGVKLVGVDRCVSDLALTCYLAYSWFAHTVLRAWPAARKFFCDCTYLELERIESWRGSSCHCGWNELHRVVITCRRKEEGETVNNAHRLRQWAAQRQARQVPTQFLWACLHPASALSPNICTHKRVSWPEQSGIYTGTSLFLSHLGFLPSPFFYLCPHLHSPFSSGCALCARLCHFTLLFASISCFWEAWLVKLLFYMPLCVLQCDLAQ